MVFQIVSPQEQSARADGEICIRGSFCTLFGKEAKKLKKCLQFQAVSARKGIDICVIIIATRLLYAHLHALRAGAYQVSGCTAGDGGLQFSENDYDMSIVHYM